MSSVTSCKLFLTKNIDMGGLPYTLVLWCHLPSEHPVPTAAGLSPRLASILRQPSCYPSPPRFKLPFPGSFPPPHLSFQKAPTHPPKHVKYYLLREAGLTSSPIPIPSELSLSVSLLIFDTDHSQHTRLGSWRCPTAVASCPRKRTSGDSLVPNCSIRNPCPKRRH